MFRNRPPRHQNCQQWPSFLTEWDEWEILIEDLPQILPSKFRFIWPSGFIVEEFQRSTNEIQEWSMTAMFVNGSVRNDKYINRGSSIYASYQVSVYLANRLQKRRFKCEKLTEDTWLFVRGAKNVHVFLLRNITT